MNRLIILLFLLIPVSLMAQTEVIPGVMRGKDYGVVYTLPKTEIDLEIHAMKIVYTPGEFSRYADRYLRLTDVSGQPSEYWELGAIEIKTVGVPDASETYFVKLKDKTVAPLIGLTDDGIIESINVPYTKDQPLPAEELVPAQKRKIDPRSFLTEEILITSSSAKMAELIAKEIYNIRESKNALLRGQADNMPKDGAQLKLMLDNLNEQEQAMTEMFAGTYEREEKVFNIRVVPDKEFTDRVAFRFSKKLGILPEDDLAGEPFYLTLKDMKSVIIPEDDGKGKKAEGIAYNVPGRGSVTLTNGNKTIVSGEIAVTQFGTKEFLAPVLFNKKSTVKVVFNPDTGGLVKVDREE